MFDRIQEINVTIKGGTNTSTYYLGWKGPHYPSREEVHDKLLARYPNLHPEIASRILEGQYRETFLEIL